MKYVLDANILRALPAEGRIAEDHLHQEDHLILIDSLLYEICSSSGVTDCLAQLRKLRVYAERVECWQHIGDALRKESEEKKPCPLYHEGLTRRIKAFLTSDERACDVNSAVAETKKQREDDSVRALFSSSGIFRQMLPRISGDFVGKSLEDISSFATNFVNDRDKILLVLGKGAANPVFDADIVDSTWVAWHHAKAFLAFICEFMRSNPLEDIEALTDKAKHHWINSKIDLDYAISTAFADGILTNDKTMRFICRWMHGDKNEFFQREQRQN